MEVQNTICIAITELENEAHKQSSLKKQTEGELREARITVWLTHSNRFPELHFLKEQSS